MQFSSQHLYELIKKLMQGTATEEEKKQLSEYLSRDNEAIDPDLLLFKEWENIEERDLPEGLKERVLSRIFAAGSAKGHKENHVRHIRSRSKIFRWLAASAAAAVIILLAGRWFFDSQYTGGKAAFLTVTAEKGESKKIRLPDSSEVFLNAGSQLTYPVKFAGGKRSVQLTGEAFFNVAQNESMPFVVRSGLLETTVLGTSFNVHAYPEEERLAVTVATGRVKVQSIHPGPAKDQAVVLSPGLRAVYGKSTASFSVNRVKPELAYDWKENRLFFDGATLEDICLSLERKYNVIFKIEDQALVQYKFSVTFEKLNLKESLDKLELLGDMRFIAGDTIRIRNRPAN